MAFPRPRTSEVIRVQPDAFWGLFWGLLGAPNGETPKAIEYIGKIAVKTTSLGPEIAAGSSPARATKKCIRQLALSH